MSRLVLAPGRVLAPSGARAVAGKMNFSTAKGLRGAKEQGWAYR